MAVLDYEAFSGEALNTPGYCTSGNGTLGAAGSGPYSIGRYGSGTTGVNFERQSWFGSVSTIWANFHNNQQSYNLNMFAFLDTTQFQLTLGIDASGHLQVKRGTGTVLWTSTDLYTLSAWHFIQFKAVIATGTSGSFELWVDGQQWANVTGVNTSQTGTANVNGWTLVSSSFPGRYANVLIYSTAGAAPNARTPETILYASSPSGAGAATGWTPSAGANWQNVDESPNDGDTTYNSAAGLVDDLYVFDSPVPASAVVYGVAGEATVRKDDAGSNILDILARGGTTTAASGTTMAQSTSYQRMTRLFTTDPSTGAAWSVANANASQVGIRRTT